MQEIEDNWLFLCKIDFYFTEWTIKAVFSRVAKPWVKKPLLVFISEIKNDLSLKKSNFLFLFCLKIAKIEFIPMREPSGRRRNFFPSRFASNKQISRDLHRQNAYRRLRRPDVTCFHNVNLARLVTSLTSQWRVNMRDVILCQAG